VKFSLPVAPREPCDSGLIPGAGAIKVPLVVFCVSLGEDTNGLSRRG
jgi:hypothetical protein